MANGKTTKNRRKNVFLSCVTQVSHNVSDTVAHNLHVIVMCEVLKENGEFFCFSFHFLALLHQLMKSKIYLDAKEDANHHIQSK